MEGVVKVSGGCRNFEKLLAFAWLIKSQEDRAEVNSTSIQDGVVRDRIIKFDWAQGDREELNVPIPESLLRQQWLADCLTKIQGGGEKLNDTSIPEGLVSECGHMIWVIIIKLLVDYMMKIQGDREELDDKEGNIILEWLIDWVQGDRAELDMCISKGVVSEWSHILFDWFQGDREKELRMSNLFSQHFHLTTRSPDGSSGHHQLSRKQKKAFVNKLFAQLQLMARLEWYILGNHLIQKWLAIKIQGDREKLNDTSISEGDIILEWLIDWVQGDRAELDMCISKGVVSEWSHILFDWLIRSQGDGEKELNMHNLFSQHFHPTTRSPDGSSGCHHRSRKQQKAFVNKLRKLLALARHEWYIFNHLIQIWLAVKIQGDREKELGDTSIPEGLVSEWGHISIQKAEGIVKYFSRNFIELRNGDSIELRKVDSIQVIYERIDDSIKLLNSVGVPFRGIDRDLTFVDAYSHQFREFLSENQVTKKEQLLTTTEDVHASQDEDKLDSLQLSIACLFSPSLREELAEHEDRKIEEVIEGPTEVLVALDKTEEFSWFASEHQVIEDIYVPMKTAAIQPISVVTSTPESYVALHNIVEVLSKNGLEAEVLNGTVQISVYPTKAGEIIDLLTNRERAVLLTEEGTIVDFALAVTESLMNGSYVEIFESEISDAVTSSEASDTKYDADNEHQATYQLSQTKCTTRSRATPMYRKTTNYVPPSKPIAIPDRFHVVKRLTISLSVPRTEKTGYSASDSNFSDDGQKAAALRRRPLKRVRFFRLLRAKLAYNERQGELDYDSFEDMKQEKETKTVYVESLSL